MSPSSSRSGATRANRPTPDDEKAATIKIVRAILASHLPQHVQRTACALAGYGHADGTSIRPGVPRLARELGITERGIQKHLTVLRACGFLRPDGHGLRGGRNRPTRYVLDLSVLESLKRETPASPFIPERVNSSSPFSVSAKGELHDVKGERFDVKGERQFAKRVNASSPDLVIDLAKRSCQEISPSTDDGISQSQDQELPAWEVCADAEQAACRRIPPHVDEAFWRSLSEAECSELLAAGNPWENEDAAWNLANECSARLDEIDRELRESRDLAVSHRAFAIILSAIPTEWRRQLDWPAVLRGARSDYADHGKPSDLLADLKRRAVQAALGVCEVVR